MANVLANIPKAISSSTDLLHREFNLSHHDPLVCMQYATSYYEVSTMQSIKLTGKSKKCFHYFYLIPDSKSLAKNARPPRMTAKLRISSVRTRKT